MEVIVCKFGGSSVADAGQIRKVAAIIRSDPRRRFIVVSAPGKRKKEDEKITDLLYGCQESAAQGKSFAAAFAAKGFAAACVGYRLRPEVDIPQCVEDVKAATRWVRANAAKYNIDADRIGAYGGSAGAHLAAMLGTSFKAKKLEGKGGNEGVSSRVHAVVAMATPSDFTKFSRAFRGDKEAAAGISGYRSGLLRILIRRYAPAFSI